MKWRTKAIKIWDKVFVIDGDGKYLAEMNGEFDRENVAVFARLCDTDSRVLDVGANIGITAIAFSRICLAGQVAAIEPLPHVYEYLRRNISASGAANVKTFNFALGSCEAAAVMQGHPSDYAASFIADKYQIPATDHSAHNISIRRLDETFSELSLDRLDFMKVDVEGFELEVFAGAEKTLATYEPIVFFEMNHWCLNIYRQMSIPDFRKRVMKLFPYVYAINGLECLDFRDERNVHWINFNHVHYFKFMNLIAGFDCDELVRRLAPFLRR